MTHTPNIQGPQGGGTDPSTPDPIKQWEILVRESLNSKLLKDKNLGEIITLAVGPLAKGELSPDDFCEQLKARCKELKDSNTNENQLDLIEEFRASGEELVKILKAIKNPSSASSLDEPAPSGSSVTLTAEFTVVAKVNLESLGGASMPPPDLTSLSSVVHKHELSTLAQHLKAVPEVQNDVLDKCGKLLRRLEAGECLVTEVGDSLQKLASEIGKNAELGDRAATAKVAIEDFAAQVSTPRVSKRAANSDVADERPSENSKPPPANSDIVDKKKKEKPADGAVTSSDGGGQGNGSGGAVGLGGADPGPDPKPGPKGNIVGRINIPTGPEWLKDVPTTYSVDAIRDLRTASKAQIERLVATCGAQDRLSEAKVKIDNLLKQFELEPWRGLSDVEREMLFKSFHGVKGRGISSTGGEIRDRLSVLVLDRDSRWFSEFGDKALDLDMPVAVLLREKIGGFAKRAERDYPKELSSFCLRMFNHLTEGKVTVPQFLENCEAEKKRDIYGEDLAVFGFVNEFKSGVIRELQKLTDPTYSQNSKQAQTVDLTPYESLRDQCRIDLVAVENRSKRAAKDLFKTINSSFDEVLALEQEPKKQHKALERFAAQMEKTIDRAARTRGNDDPLQIFESRLLHRYVKDLVNTLPPQPEALTGFARVSQLDKEVVQQLLDSTSKKQSAHPLGGLLFEINQAFDAVIIGKLERKQFERAFKEKINTLFERGDGLPVPISKQQWQVLSEYVSKLGGCAAKVRQELTEASELFQTTKSSDPVAVMLQDLREHLIHKSRNEFSEPRTLSNFENYSVVRSELLNRLDEIREEDRRLEATKFVEFRSEIAGLATKSASQESHGKNAKGKDEQSARSSLSDSEQLIYKLGRIIVEDIEQAEKLRADLRSRYATIGEFDGMPAWMAADEALRRSKQSDQVGPGDHPIREICRTVNAAMDACSIPGQAAKDISRAPHDLGWMEARGWIVRVPVGSRIHNNLSRRDSELAEGGIGELSPDLRDSLQSDSKLKKALLSIRDGNDHPQSLAQFKVGDDWVLLTEKGLIKGRQLLGYERAYGKAGYSKFDGANKESRLHTDRILDRLHEQYVGIYDEGLNKNGMMCDHDLIQSAVTAACVDDRVWSEYSREVGFSRRAKDVTEHYAKQGLVSPKVPPNFGYGISAFIFAERDQPQRVEQTLSKIDAQRQVNGQRGQPYSDIIESHLMSRIPDRVLRADAKASVEKQRAGRVAELQSAFRRTDLDWKGLEKPNQIMTTLLAAANLDPAEIVYRYRLAQRELLQYRGIVANKKEEPGALAIAASMLVELGGDREMIKVDCRGFIKTLQEMNRWGWSSSPANFPEAMRLYSHSLKKSAPIELKAAEFFMVLRRVESLNVKMGVEYDHSNLACAVLTGPNVWLLSEHSKELFEYSIPDNFDDMYLAPTRRSNGSFNPRDPRKKTRAEPMFPTGAPPMVFTRRDLRDGQIGNMDAYTQFTDPTRNLR